jgi:hypothetical protein
MTPVPLRSSDPRCHDPRCLVKEHCERWLQRETGEPYTVHAATLREGWSCFDDPCSKSILVGETTS